MEEFELVEADFQQYYRLDIAELGFRRYCRLFNNLPPDSRIMKKWAPVASWRWENEATSRVLYQLEVVAAILYNSNSKKGSKPMTPGEQFQPDEVKKAKEDYRAKKEAEERIEHAKLVAFWQKRNPGMRIG